MAKCSKLLFLFAVGLFFTACGEVGGLEETTPCVDGGTGFKGCPSSGSGATELSSSSVFYINLNWQDTPKNSFVHGDTAIRVELDSYMISRNLITQEQYKSVMGVNPAKGKKNDTMPVEGVTWFKAVEFCKKLSLLLNLDSNAIRLPTEAEWEYAVYPAVAHRNADYWEWTNDCFDSDFPYGGAPGKVVKNPSGPPNCLPNAEKVLKGFGFDLEERFPVPPNWDDKAPGDISFRVVVRVEDWGLGR